MSHTFGDLFTYGNCDSDRHEHIFYDCTLLKNLGLHEKGECIALLTLDHFSGELSIQGETDDGEEIYEKYVPNYQKE